MGKYRLPPNNIVDAHAALERRLSRMERNPRAIQTGVNKGNTVFDGGVLRVNDALGNVAVNPPIFVVNGRATVGTDNYIAINRNTSGPFGNSRALEFFDTNASFPNFSLYDKQDNITLSDAYNTSAHGFGDPRWHVHFYDPNTKTAFTSSSYTNYRSGFWYMYHPHLRVTCLCQVDAATTGAIRVKENGAVVQDEAILAASSNAYVDLIVDRRNTNLGSYPNGDVAILDVEVKRTSGAGNVNVAFVEAIAIDLSFLW